ncbi:MAG: pyridoxal-phosphate dependent enzyme [Acidobacteriota bacterium]
MKPLCPIPLAEIRAAQERNAGGAIRTPLIRLPSGDADRRIYLKLESLQPIGSFKLRGAGNAIAAAAESHDLTHGVYTASVGNMAQGVAWGAQRLGVPCRVVVPETAPQNKIDAVLELGGEVVTVSFDDWWQVLTDHHHPGEQGVFIHPVSNAGVIAGNGVIGLEILDDLPEVDAVIAPFGGGGLSGGIASALRELRPEARVFASEVETAAPLSASLAAGEATAIDYTPTFVEGVGGKSVLAEMWPLAQALLSGSIVVSLRQIAAAIRLLAERCNVIAEGAAATSVAAALTGRAGNGNIVCVISGGNIAFDRLATVLSGRIPEI